MLLQPTPCGPVDRYFCTAGFYMVFSFIWQSILNVKIDQTVLN